MLNCLREDLKVNFGEQAFFFEIYSTTASVSDKTHTGFMKTAQRKYAH